MERPRYWLRQGRGELRRELFHWGGLPPELQLMVLKNLVPPLDKVGFVRTRDSHLAAYSAVCREWQYVFEKIIYHRLVLSQDDVPRFAELTVHHASLVRHLWLRVELLRYDCSWCRGSNNAVIEGGTRASSAAPCLNFSEPSAASRRIQVRPAARTTRA